MTEPHKHIWRGFVNGEPKEGCIVCRGERPKQPEPLDTPSELDEALFKLRTTREVEHNGSKYYIEPYSNRLMNISRI